MEGRSEAAPAMDVKLEAQRVMAVALGKMYNSRLQRGGIRLHRSLLLSLVLRSARDVYLNVGAEQQEAGRGSQAEAPAMELEAAEGGGLEARPKGEECAAQSQCIQSQEKGIKSQECIQSQTECIQSQEKCIQFQQCIQSQKDCIEPRECIQSQKECIQPGSHSVQSQEDCIQRRECLHCGRDKVSEFAQRPVAEPLAGNGCLCPGQEPREAAGSRSRKRRKGWDQREPLECLPRKRARLEEDCSREAAPDQESSSNPSLVNVFSSGFSGLLNKGQSDSPGICRDRVLSKLGIWVRAIVAY
ncbi:immediate early response 2b [Scyliorhinus canicula]|uniref:immediate early response 2b n=1 Tax=Scyliorhinus canicula TaxID=7830 RepID=UPI0018F41CE5|nr:immediate early response 2b [Scyliorhinus canicula]